MTNEAQVVNLMVQKVWQPIIRQQKSEYGKTLIPYSKVYEIMGRRGFHKNETRILGQFFESRHLLTISKHGWLVKP